jgi:2-keto-4-pentenoate hydratase/2-oxohepta-3-ene-1,7-dioic acid hydratase in catechol pathway
VRAKHDHNLPDGVQKLISGFFLHSIGRNYADHAKELGNAVPKEPFFFLKPTSSYLDNNGTVEIPQGIKCHYEGQPSRRMD